jgi:peptide/nickel transport system substrate-binding protein
MATPELRIVNGDRSATRKESTMTKRPDDVRDVRYRLSRRGFMAGTVGAAGVLALGGPHAVRHAGAQDDEATIIIATLGEAQTINPFTTQESEGDWRCKMLFDRFVRLDPTTYAPIPGLAASWTIDGLKFTFALQPNAKFSDGSDVTADDVAFTIKGHLAPTTGSSRQGLYSFIAGAQEYIAGSAQDVSGIVVVDPKTLEVTLAQPDASFLLNLRYIYVAPKALLDGKSLTDDPFFQNPVGAGPFVFQSWDTGADFVATKNPHFWQTGKPLLNSFTHRVIADSQSIVLALQSGDVDASIYPVPTAAEELKQNEDLEVLVPPFNSPNGWMFNLKNEWLAKKEVRKAIAMALDTAQFANDSLLGLGKPGNGPIAPDSWAYDPDLTPIPYDVEAAKALIAQADMPEGTQIRFIVNQGNVLREDWLTFTQQALKEIGIEVVPEVIEYATLVDRVTGSLDYDACGVDFYSSTADPASEIYRSFYTGSPGNYFSYSNPELDALLDQARAELDIEKAKPIFKQIQAIIMDDVPMFFAWYRPFIHVIRKEFTGYTDSNLDEGLFETLEDVSKVQS